MSLNVVILAAGAGKRMHSRLPKVLHALAGRPLLAHVIDTARKLEASRIVVVYGHGAERVCEAVTGADLAFARQELQLGTGHAVQQALALLTEARVTLVLYGDVPLIGRDTLERLVQASRDSVVVLTAELEDPAGYGRILRTPAGAIRAIVEEKDASAAERDIREVNTGMMALPTSRLSGWLSRLTNDNAQGEYYLTDVVKLALEDGVGIESVRVARPWETLGVNSRAQLAQLERIYQREYASALMETGVTIADPARFDVRGELACGRDVMIDVNCVFEGKVSLADDVKVGANSVLRNVSVGAGARIEPFSHLEDAAIGERCRIGPYARIRPGTHLGADVHIGNFVEVKASEIADGSKANHLAYIGDTTVGRNVNIAAGTIVCNYDDAYKQRTVIEDDAFIGSDTQRVAPVTIRRVATIGAGSTNTREVAAGEVAPARARRKTIAGWKRPQKKSGS